MNKEYDIKLTEKEMQAVCSALTKLFNRMTANKEEMPLEVAQILMSALQKMKYSIENPKHGIVIV